MHAQSVCMPHAQPVCMPHAEPVCMPHAQPASMLHAQPANMPHAKLACDNINNNLTAFESYLDDQITESDYFHETSILEITKISKNVKNSNSVGWNNIPTNIFKTNGMTLAPILSNLINKS